MLLQFYFDGNITIRGARDGNYEVVAPSLTIVGEHCFKIIHKIRLQCFDLLTNEQAFIFFTLLYFPPLLLQHFLVQRALGVQSKLLCLCSLQFLGLFGLLFLLGSAGLPLSRLMGPIAVVYKWENGEVELAEYFELGGCFFHHQG